jgi:TolB protein
MKTFRLLILLPLVAAAFGAAGAAPAHAVWPGVNGDIVFQRNLGGGNTEIYVMHDNGSSPTRITNNAVQDSGPKWSPTGPAIIFASDRSGNGDIYQMDNNGANIIQLTNTADVDAQPAFSPDGLKIVFMRNDGSGDRLWVMSNVGTHQHPITKESTGADDEPVWSPNGKSIAYYHSGGKRGIYTINPKGTNKFRVTTGNDYDPDWSPTGNRIAFSRERTSDWVIMTVKPTGSGTQQVTANGQDFYDPGYSPDGTRILTAGGGNPYSIYSIPPGGGATTQLTFATNDLEPDEARV